MAPDPNDHARFALSFTSGGLLAREADVITTVYLRERDWTEVRNAVTNGNLLQSRTVSSSARVTRETIQRLSTFDDAELELLADGSPTERCQLMWVAACRRYELIGDFAEEVLRERFLLLTPTLDFEDFERFIVKKGLWHPELDELKPSTRAKLRQNLFRMLHESGLLSERGEIVPAVLSERVHEVVVGQARSDVRFFPTNLSIEAATR